MGNTRTQNICLHVEDINLAITSLILSREVAVPSMGGSMTVHPAEGCSLMKGSTKYSCSEYSSHQALYTSMYNCFNSNSMKHDLTGAASGLSTLVRDHRQWA